MKPEPEGGPRLWQWPNILSLDAALVAVAWQCLYAESWDLPIDPAAAFVLGASVWLAYVADRVLDSARRPYRSLLSVRHRFTKRNFRPFLAAWLTILAIDLIVALRFLDAGQVRAGSVLLGTCVAYTALNQVFFRRFVPKEGLVALLFAGGVAVFLLPGEPGPDARFVASLLPFAASVFFNCMLIADRELRIDRAMGLRTVAALYPRHHRALTLTGILCLLVTFDIPAPSALRGALLSAQAGLLCLHWQSRHMHSETVRVLADSVMLVAPAATLLFACLR